MHRWASVRAVHTRLERAHDPRAQTDVPAPLLAQGDGGIGARAPGLGGAARTPCKPSLLSDPCVLRYVPRGCLKCAWVRRQEVFARLGPEARAMIAPTPAAPEEEGGTLSAKL